MTYPNRLQRAKLAHYYQGLRLRAWKAFRHLKENGHNVFAHYLFIDDIEDAIENEVSSKSSLTPTEITLIQEYQNE